MMRMSTLARHLPLPLLLGLAACGGPPGDGASAEPAALRAGEQDRDRDDDDDARRGAQVGGPLSGLSEDLLALFRLGGEEFARAQLPRDGLGPVYIERACGTCHNLGGLGGADPLRDPNHLVRRFATITNGAYDPLAALGGDVLQTRSISPLQPGCTVAPEQVPQQATILSQRNPLPVFGDGLIDAIPDAVILAGVGPKGDGVVGKANLDANGRPGRFGWKAQGNTLIAFSATAANGTMGITTSLSPNEPLPQGQPIPPGCQPADVGATSPNDQSGAFLFSVTGWQALLAPPRPQPLSPTAQRGRAVFERIGCAKCHTPELTTGSYSLALRGGGSVAVPQLSNQQVELYSDLLLHDMGPGLDEGVVMRQARGPEFRTAPLWGVSVRERFLHDGRADSVDQAIRLHGGEATVIRDRYAALRHDERGALLRFLKAL